MLSTSDTPDNAASPTRATIAVSAMPMVSESVCSSISGQIMRARSRPVNSGFSPAGGVYSALSFASILLPPEY